MKNITVILPVHKINEDYKEMLYYSVESVKQFYNDVKLLIVAPNTLKKDLSEIDLGQKLEIKYHYHNSDTDFCSQINEGAKICDTEWFSIF